MPSFEPEWRLPDGEILLQIEVPSSPTYKDPLVLRILRALTRRGCLSLDDRPRVELCLDEAIKNAMIHGNRSSPDRLVRVVVSCNDADWIAVIEDEGDGMTPDAVPDPPAEGLSRESGYGILLMDSCVRELLYAGRGNRLVLICELSTDGGRARDTLAEVVLPSDAVLARSEYVDPADPSVASLALELEPPGPRDAPAAGPRIAATTRHVIVIEDRGARVLKLQTSRISDANAEQVGQELIAAMRDGQPVVVELSSVDYLSSNALGVLVRLCKTAAQVQAPLCLCGLTAHLRNLLSITHLDRILPISDDVESAIAATAGAGGAPA